MDVSTPMNSFDKKWLFSGGEGEEGEEGQVQTVRSKMHSASRKNVRSPPLRKGPFTNDVNRYFVISDPPLQ